MRRNMTPRRLCRDSRMRNERGMLLVLTMVILLVLSSLAGASLVNSLLERSQVRTQGNAAIALNAAEAGVAAGLAWLSDPNNIDGYIYPQATGDVPDPTKIVNAYTTSSAWKKWHKELQRTFPNGGSYSVSLLFARERRDRNNNGNCCDTYPTVTIDEDGEYQDGDSNSCTAADQCYQPDPGNPDEPLKLGEVILYNAGTTGDGSFGFSDSYYSGSSGDEGFPVLEIEAVGTYGASSVRQIALMVARNHKAQIEGAFTARASVTAGGSSTVDGRNYNSAGTGPGSCGSDLPGVTVDVAGSAPPCGSHISSGSAPCSANFDPTLPGKRPLAKTPWGVLNMSEVDFRSMFTKDDAATNIPQPCSTEPYYLWFSRESIKFNNSSGCNSYTGILVVHNEGFDPDAWASNCATAASMSSAYCSNPANQPAVFDMNGNVKWTGVVIADQVMLVNGNPEIIGGVFSLASGGYGVKSEISGNISIKYSCDAVSAVTNRIGYKKKIGWRRLR